MHNILSGAVFATKGHPVRAVRKAATSLCTRGDFCSHKDNEWQGGLTDSPIHSPEPRGRPAGTVILDACFGLINAKGNVEILQPLL